MPHMEPAFNTLQICVLQKDEIYLNAINCDTENVSLVKILRLKCIEGYEAILWSTQNPLLNIILQN